MKASIILFITFFSITMSNAQFINTSLTVTVRDELGNTVEAASIKLFETEENYNQEKNVVSEGVTDSKGVYRFRKIKATSYYVLVKKGDKDNAGGGEQIGKLEDGKFNKVTIVIQ